MVFVEPGRVTRPCWILDVSQYEARRKRGRRLVVYKLCKIIVQHLINVRAYIVSTSECAFGYEIVFGICVCLSECKRTCSCVVLV